MADLVPTASKVRWGPEQWQIFDYVAHPTRDVGGNPCLIFRHGGGGTGGCMLDVWYDNSGSVSWMPIFNYLLSTSRRVHFDIISIESGQRGHTSGSSSTLGGAQTAGTQIFPRSKQLWINDQILDLKAGIAAVKSWSYDGIKQKVFFTAAKWTESSKTLDTFTPANPFAAFTAGANSPLIGQRVKISSGTGANVNDYVIATHTGPATITLVNSIGAGADTQTNIVGDVSIFSKTTTIDPTKIVLGGQSHGATLASLVSLTPPLSYGSSQRTSMMRIHEPANFDSTVCGVWCLEPQIDARTKDWGDGAGNQPFLAYGVYPGWWGTSDVDGGTQWNSLPNTIKEAMSIVAYFENGDVQYYVPHFVMYQSLGQTGQHPWSNAHDDRQMGVLQAAISAQKLPVQVLRRSSTTTDDQARQLYIWMRDCVGAGATL